MNITVVSSTKTSGELYEGVLPEALSHGNDPVSHGPDAVSPLLRQNIALSFIGACMSKKRNKICFIGGQFLDKVIFEISVLRLPITKKESLLPYFFSCKIFSIQNIYIGQVPESIE
jgi:hypothetical protein